MSSADREAKDSRQRIGRGGKARRYKRARNIIEARKKDGIAATIQVEDLGGKGVFYIRDIPKDLKDQFKAICAKKGLTMRAAIIRHMKHVINEDFREQSRLHSV